jgi:hypothetical protein
MTVTNARPNSFTQLATTQHWEDLVHLFGVAYSVDEIPGGPGLKPSLDSGHGPPSWQPEEAWLPGN